MPRIIQIIDCDSCGHKCRMDDGEISFLPHDPGCVPCIGEELTRDPATGKWSAVAGGLSHMVSGAESKPEGAVQPEQAPAPEIPHWPTAEELADLFRAEEGAPDAVEPHRSDSEGPQGADPQAEAPVG